jgi:membrane glycosyltransferase
MRLHLLRLGALASAAALTAHASGQFVRVFPPDEAGAFGRLLVVLFCCCFAWVALGAALFAFGLVATARPGRAAPPRARPGLPLDPAARTAALIPIRHEDAAQVAAQVELMFRGLQGHPLGRRVDFALLSDSSDPEACLAEEVAWRALCERLSAFGRIFYRRRAGGEGKKAGNIRDWCLRHSGAYRYLIILDADSVVAPATLCAMLERMESNPGVGLLQAPSIPVRHRTPFARWQQFAAGVYGPLWTAAEAGLAGPDGSYHGHNAILRREAFTTQAGLGLLPGRGPLSGLIASHDFVEAALIRRAGYQVWLGADLAGSYEQCPTNLVDYAVRDGRWCHGNLQHLRVAVLPGLRLWSRLHLVRGALSYLIPPLTLVFTWLTLLVAARVQAYQPVYFPPASGKVLFPRWPVHDFAAGLGLLALTAVLLFGPKLLATVAALGQGLRSRRLPLRRVPAFLASVLAENVLGALLAPTLMVYQTVFVARTLLGERAAWGSAARSDRTVGLLEALRRTWPQLLCALLLALAARWVSPAAFSWSLPLVVPLLLAPLLTWATSSERLGRWLDRLRLLQVPEDWSQDPALAVYDRPPSAPADPAALLSEPRARAWHTLVTVGSGLSRR